jgi:hypothetical protein
MITNYIVYPNPAPSIVGATPSLIDSADINDAKLVFASTADGRPTNRGGTGQVNAITTIALCNTAAPNNADETANSVSVNIWIVPNGQSANPYNLVVSNLPVPAGETVFFNEERIILNGSASPSQADEIYVAASNSSVTPKLAVTVSSLPV